MDTNQIGKAYKAWIAFNYKEKLDRVKDFKPKRWLKVVKALEEKSLPKAPRRQLVKSSKKWTHAQREKYLDTIHTRTRIKNGHA